MVENIYIYLIIFNKRKTTRVATLTVIRFYKYENDLVGFFCFSFFYFVSIYKKNWHEHLWFLIQFFLFATVFGGFPW